MNTKMYIVANTHLENSGEILKQKFILTGGNTFKHLTSQVNSFLPKGEFILLVVKQRILTHF